VSILIDMTIILVYNQLMLTINIVDAKTNLSRYLEEAKPGEIITICRRNLPIAELKRLPDPPAARRPLGLCRGEVVIHDGFLDPLPNDVFRLFSGEEL
jgi:antitoxin (DNA-binding transcriptional repressor) of toxin-antitoxin stability system